MINITCLSIDLLGLSVFHLAGKLTRRGSTEMAADSDSLSVKHTHSHHNLPEHTNSHVENTIREGGKIQTVILIPYLH